MERSITLNPQTYDFVNYLYQIISRNTDRFFLPDNFIRNFYYEPKPEYIAYELKKLNSIMAEYQIEPEAKPLLSGENISDWYWLTYDNNIEIIPIYDDAISLVQKELIINPSEISYLLRYIVIPGSRNGVDIENHNFGYHFHYGNVKKNSLKRTDLLLTFDPKETYPKTPPSAVTPLYSEKHGGYKTIDISTIGDNKRRPIYNVCESEMAKRGIKNFKSPATSALVFYQ